MSRERLTLARGLIQEGNYQAAREILLTLPDDPTAQRWLAKLDKKVRPAKPPTSTGRKVLYVIAGILVLTVIGSLLPKRTPVTNDRATVPLLTAAPNIQPSLASPRRTIRFDSQNEGLQAVIDDVDLPTGDYTARVITDGYFILTVQAESGVCDAGRMGTLFNVIGGTATDGAEAVLTSSDCVATLEISNALEPWYLEFVPID